jgi:hypothetical protein
MPKVQLSNNGKARIWKIAATDLVFLWDECQRCFYRRVVEGVTRPRSPFPGIFSIIDNRMKTSVDGIRTDAVQGMPPGTMRFSESFVESSPILLPGHPDAIVVRGKFDVIATLDDGSYAIVDLKTLSAVDAKIERYVRQLWAYTYAVENAAPGKPSFKPVNAIGLLIYQPVMFTHRRGVASLIGDLEYVPMKRDDVAFLALMTTVITVLEAPTAPPKRPNCEFCR